MVDFEAANARLQDLLDRVGSPRPVSADEPLYCGLDVGTAFIVSLTALGGFLAPADASSQVVTMAGVHAAFCGMCVLLIIVVLGILIFVHEKDSKKAPTGAAASGAAGADSQVGAAAGPFVAFPSLEGSVFFC